MTTRRDDQAHPLDALLSDRTTRRDLMRRAAALGLSGPALAALLAARGASAHAAQGTPAAATGSITWALESDPANLVPYGGVSTSNMWGKEFMYDSLLAWDRDLNVVPALAESFEAPDASTYVFHLRQGVKFHDGAEMTAKDVKYSLELAMNPPAPGVKHSFINIATIEIVDDYTVRFAMTKPDPTLPGVLAWTRYSPIVPEGMFDRLNVLSEGIGTGPFQLVEFVPNDRVVYTRFPDHWKTGTPCIADLTLKVLPDEQSRLAALRSGEIDGGTFSADVARTLEGDDSLTILSGLFSEPRVVQFTTTGEPRPWHDVRVRQAINLVVDRQLIIDNVYGGEAELTGPIPPGYGDWFIPPDELAANFYTLDVDAAKALMAEAGFADGFDVTLQAIAAPRDFTQIAEIVREQVKPLNINVTVQPLEIGTFATNIGSGEFEWASTGRGMRGDPSGYVIDFREGTANNQVWFGTGWKNDELNAAYDEALATADVARRKELYRRIQEIILTEVANLYTVQNKKFQVVRNRVQNMYVSFTAFNTGLREACVVEE